MRFSEIPISYFNNLIPSEVYAYFKEILHLDRTFYPYKFTF